jgi:amino acid transporter
MRPRVANREQKRTERRKRKARSGGLAGTATEAVPAAESPMQRGYAKAEQRNEEVRETLVPLHEGERPLVITIGACFSGLIALIFWVSAVVAIFSSAKVNGHEPHPLQLALVAAVLTTMAVGMWRSRYWAVLGFQMVLVLFLLAGTAGLVGATTVAQVIGTVLLVLVCLAFFLFMVKAMARIQMPGRVPRD